MLAGDQNHIFFFEKLRGKLGLTASHLLSLVPLFDNNPASGPCPWHGFEFHLRPGKNQSQIINCIIIEIRRNPAAGRLSHEVHLPARGIPIRPVANTAVTVMIQGRMVKPVVSLHRARANRDMTGPYNYNHRQ